MPSKYIIYIVILKTIIHTDTTSQSQMQCENIIGKMAGSEQMRELKLEEKKKNFVTFLCLKSDCLPRNTKQLKSY